MSEINAEDTKNAFDSTVERAMECIGRKEWRSALDLFKEALEVDRKEEGGEISEERADCAYNMACCAAQLGDLDEAEAWLRRAVLWGVRHVRPESDDDLEPLRVDTLDRLNRFLTTIEPLTSSSPSTAAVLDRTKRSNAGRGMSALAKEMAAEGWEDEDDEGFEEDEAEQDRDVFDSDFDDSEEDSDEPEESAPKKKEKQAAKPEAQKQMAPVGSKRAAAHKAQAINAVAVCSMEDDDDDEDGDFEDAAVDADIGTLEPRQVSAREAVSEAVRKRKAQEAWAELDGDDDLAVVNADMSKSPQKKQRRVVYARRRSSKKSAIGVLGQIFGKEAATKILARAKANVARRVTELQLKLNSTAPARSLKRRTVVEKKRFAGEQVEVERTVLADAQVPSKPATTGIDAVIAEIKGPQTITTVAKSALDWDAFKTKEGLEDSLRDASKNGYLANQDFLERCDLRAFDREREERERQRAFRDAQAPSKITSAGSP